MFWALLTLAGARAEICVPVILLFCLEVVEIARKDFEGARVFEKSVFALD